MEKLTTLIEESSKQHYHVLAIIMNSDSDKEKIEKILNFLESLHWEKYDLEEIILSIVDKIPENKLKIRINEEIKKWIYTINKKSILINNNILCSPTLGTKGTITTLKYLFRDEKETVVFLDATLRGNDTAFYSEPGKEDYQEYDLSEIIYINLDEIVIE